MARIAPVISIAVVLFIRTPLITQIKFHTYYKV